MKLHRCYPIACLLLLFTALVSRAEEAPGLTPVQVLALQQEVAAEVKAQGIPGLSAAVATGRQLQWTEGYGFSDLENFVPADRETVYRLGSVSKPITAAAVLQLWEQGKLDLDAPIQKYVAEFPAKKWPVTARQLLGHLGGVRHYRGTEIESTRHYASLTEGLSIFKDEPLQEEPGTKYVYSTYGYSLLGCAVEEASGLRFPEYLQTQVFKPAGMSRIYVDDVQAIIPHRAQGYVKAKDGNLRNSGLADTSYKIPGGGLCSTAAELARFGAALEAGKLLKPETLKLMWTSQRTRDGKETSYGLGWGVKLRGTELLVSHGGAQQRTSTYLYLRPEKGCAVALMCNLEGAQLAPLAERLGELAAP